MQVFAIIFTNYDSDHSLNVSGSNIPSFNPKCFHNFRNIILNSDALNDRHFPIHMIIVWRVMISDY